MLIEQIELDDILSQADRLGIRHAAGPVHGVVIPRVEVAAADELADVPPGALVVVPAPTASYQIDITVREAAARGFSALIVTGCPALPETARLVAERAGLPVLTSDTRSATELGVVVDRIVRGGAAEVLARAEAAIEEVAAIAAAAPAPVQEAVLAAASRSLGTPVVLVEAAEVTPTQRAAVYIGDVAVGRLEPGAHDAAAQVALPVIAAVLSRALHQETTARFAPVRERADLVLALLFAESSRVDGFAVDAAHLGVPLQLSHAVAWLRLSASDGGGMRPPASVRAAIELQALRLVDGRPEVWQVAPWHDDLVLVASEEHGAGDHQRRLRDVADALRAFAGTLASGAWTFTVGLGTPQAGAAGLRQSGAEARIAAESAIAAGRAGVVQVTDVTGLRRVLLDFYASPLSRRLLDDVLAPLDALGPERAQTAVRTLLAYLRHRNSLVRAGQELTLHPNAVNYRIRRIERVLGLDLDDPDNRFALELACRVRALDRA